MKTMELNPEWILMMLQDAPSVTDDGTISIYIGDAAEGCFIKLALDSLHIPYTAMRYLDESGNRVFNFDFNIEDIKEECPSFYQSMKTIQNSFDARIKRLEALEKKLKQVKQSFLK